MIYNSLANNIKEIFTSGGRGVASSNLVTPTIENQLVRSLLQGGDLFFCLVFEENCKDLQTFGNV